MPEVTDIGGMVASLRVLDEFTAPIKAALDQIAELEEALGRFKDASAGMSGPFTRLGSAIARAQGPLSDLAAKLDSLDAPISAAADRLAAVKDRTAAIAAESAAAARNFAAIGRVRIPSPSAARPALAAAGGGGKREGGGGHGGGIVGYAEGAAEGAGLGYVANRVMSIPGLAVGFAAYHSFQQAMTEQLALTQTLAMFNVAGASAAQKAAYLSTLHDIARQAAIGTIYTETETAQAMLGAAQMAGFTGKAGLAQFASVFPIALRMAEVGQMQGLGSIEDNIKAAIGYAHLTQRYSAAQLVPGLDEVLAIAERTHTSIAQTLTTMKYGLPMAVAAGANVDQAAAAIGFLMRAGLGRSAGFSIGQMILGVLTAGGPINAQLAQYRAAVDRALGKSAPKFQNLTAHVAALKDLGILDKAGHLAVLNKQGGVDIGKILTDIQRYGAHHTQSDLADVLYKAFGIRGMRGATLLALQKDLFAAFEKLIAGTPGAAAQQATFAQTPLQEFEQLLARLQDIGNVLATELLPDLGKFLGFLDRTLGVVDRYLGEHHVAAGAAGGAAVGAAVGSVIPGVGTAAGAVVGAGIGAAVAMPEGAPVPHQMIGSGKAAAALFGRPILPQGTHGDPIYTHPLAMPPAPPGPVTVNQDFHVTVNGITDTLGIPGLLNQWWGTHRGDVAAAARDAVGQQQQHSKRRTFLDPAGSLGGYAP